MMKRTLTAASEAAFGSHVRGDNDSLSDRDYLIVDDDVLVLKARERDLVSRGYSVASFTFRKLQYLASCRALFVQHLKLESELICDRGGRLASLLKRFQPANSYRNEITQNFAFLRLAGSRPASMRGDLWAADVLHVAIRNHLILSLAETKHYAFGFEQVLSMASAFDLVSAKEIELLRPLRFLKSIYRSGQDLSGQNFTTEVDRIFDGIHLLESVEAFRLNAEDTLAKCRADCGMGGYLSLRNVERALLANSLVAGDGGALLQTARRWIAKPRAYSAWAASREDVVLNRLEAQICSGASSAA